MGTAHASNLTDLFLLVQGAITVHFHICGKKSSSGVMSSIMYPCGGSKHQSNDM